MYIMSTVDKMTTVDILSTLDICWIMHIILKKQLDSSLIYKMSRPDIMSIQDIMSTLDIMSRLDIKCLTSKYLYELATMMPKYFMKKVIENKLSWIQFVSMFQKVFQSLRNFLAESLGGVTIWLHSSGIELHISTTEIFSRRFSGELCNRFTKSPLMFENYVVRTRRYRH